MFRSLLFCACLLAATQARSEAVLVAVAANFYSAAEAIAQAFGSETGHRVSLSSGSSGKLYAQIRAGAPFDVLLSADADIPGRLEAEGLSVAGSRYAYAFGRLVLWSPEIEAIDADPRAALTDPRLRHIAIANPQLAPYGLAAQQALEGLGLWQALAPKVVMGENVGQAHALVATGAARLGLVALSGVATPGRVVQGSYWEVPQELFAPIRQEAVLLDRAKNTPAARAFWEWMHTPQALEIIVSHGYRVAP